MKIANLDHDLEVYYRGLPVPEVVLQDGGLRLHEWKRTTDKFMDWYESFHKANVDV